MADNNAGINFDLDVSRLPQQASVVTKALNKINSALSDISNQVLIFNKNGDIVEKRLEGMSKEGVKFTATLSGLNKLFPDVDVQASKLTKTIQQLRKEQEAFNALQRVTANKGQQVDRDKELSALKRSILERDKIRTASSDAANRKITADVISEQKKRTTALREAILKRAALERVAAEKHDRLIAQQTAKDQRQQERKTQSAASAQKRLQAGELQTARIVVQSLIAKQKASRERIKLTEGERAAIIRLGASESRLNASLNSLSGQFVSTGTKGKEAGKKVLLSWKSVARLFLVQILHQSIAQLRLLLQGAATEAIEFSKRVAEVRTIIGDASETTRDWSAALGEISADLPFKQLEVVEAAYQALSNQIIDTTSQLGFLRDAGKLALVGASDLTTSVNTLTSIINAFGNSAGTSTEISAVLFKTIEQGRTRLELLEQNLGRVSILSARLGISFKEQQAALDTLTIQGLKDNVSKTLLINVYNKLIRPTERMKELFKQWGVTSGENAIATFGLVGVLQKLNDVSRESGDTLGEVGEIFNRIRSTIGFLGLDVDTFTKNLKKMNSAGTEFNKKFEEVRNTLGNRIQQQLVLVNNLVLQLGTSFLKAVDFITQNFARLDKVVLRLTQLFTNLGAAFTVVLIIRQVNRLRIAFTALRAAIIFANAALGGFGGPLAALGVLAAGVLIKMANDWVFWEITATQAIDDVRKGVQELNDEFTQRSEAALTAWVNNFDTASQQLFQSLDVVQSEIRRLLDLMQIDLTGSFEDLGDVANDFTDIVEGNLKSAIDELADSVKDVTTELQKATREVDRLDEAIDKSSKALGERQFEDKIRGLTKTQQATAREKRASDLTNPEDARRELEKALRLQEQVKRDIIRRAERTVTDVLRNRPKKLTQKQIDALKQKEVARQLAASGVDNDILRINQEITQTRKDRLALDRKAALDAQQREAEAEGELDILKEQKRVEEEAAKAFAKARDQFKSFDVNAQIEKISKQVKIPDPVARQKEITKQLLAEFDKRTDAFFEEARASETSLEKIEAFQKEVAKRRTQIAEDSKNKLFAIEQERIQKELNARKEEFKRRKNDVVKAEKEVRNEILDSRKEVSTELERLQQALQRVPTPGTLADPAVDQRARLDDRIKRIQKALALEKQLNEEQNKKHPNQAVLDKLLERRRTLLREIVAIEGTDKDVGLDRKTKLPGGDTVGKSLDVLSQATVRLQAALDKQEKAREAAAGIDAALSKLLDTAKALHLDRDNQLDATKNNTKSIQDLTSEMNDLLTQLFNLQKAVEDAARGREITPPPTGARSQPGAPGNPLPKALGGLIHGPGGIDNVPAWLTAGEYVVNARATREFLPVLQAINTGNAQRFAQGGSVQNISFGDITITGGQTSEITARALVRDIKREMRRGTVTL